MIEDCLVVGGGVGGMSAAVALARAGVGVTLIDADPNWRVYGAGISMTGITLRALDDLGVYDEVARRGFVPGGFRGRSVAGKILMEQAAPADAAPIQRGGGILRPVLHDILSSVVRRERVEVRLGVTVTDLQQESNGANVRFSDGRESRFDLVVGADGIYSSIRTMVFPEAPRPKFTGQGCWRVVAARPAEVDRTEMYFGGPVKLGVNPVSQEQMYLFLLEHTPANPRFVEEMMAPHVRELMAPFGGHIPAVRASIIDASQLNYRPLEWLMMPDPWYRGRVVLIGDAAHATTPHLASGAGIAAEDGLVLAEELKRHDVVERALRAFMHRRFPRARLVVENSVRIGEIEMAGENPKDGPVVLGATMEQLQQPY